MINFLFKAFIKNAGDTANAKVRTAYGYFCGRLTLVVNLILAGIKLAAGLFTGSIAIIADALNSLSDALTSVISLLGFKLSEKPADKEHPFGHARFEYIASMLVSLFILLVGFEFLVSSIKKIIAPEAVTLNFYYFLALVVSIAAKICLSYINGAAGKRINSVALSAVSRDSLSDVIGTGGILIGAAVGTLAGVNIDGYLGLFVSCFILYSGVMALKDCVGPLLGEGAPQELIDELYSYILKFDGVLSMHDVLVHSYGPGRHFASAHVEMAAKKDVLESHDIIDRIERGASELFNVKLVLHYDPVETDNEQVHTLRMEIGGLLQQVCPGAGLHDLRIVAGPMHTNIIFDIDAPFDAPPDYILVEQLTVLIKSLNSNYYPVITVDRS